MASFRKKYAETSPRQDGPPVTTAPTGAAKLPEPVADPKPPEMPETTESPADAAAKDAIALQLRLKEMERAERLQQPHAAEPPQEQQPQAPEMPVHISKWLAEHPEYMNPNDHVAQAEIYTATLKCNRDGKNWDQPDFLPTLERHLGLRQQQQRPQPSNGNAAPTPPPAPRNVEPPRQQQRSNFSMSAPPTREVPSMASGRVPSRRVALTSEQLEAARFSGVSPEEYERQLRKMEAMRAAGALDDRR